MSIVNYKQVAEKSILDAFNRQTYLGNSYIACLENSSISGTSETPLLLIQNPATSTKNIFQDGKKVSCYTASQSALFRFYYNPTVTSAGTPYTPVNLRSLSGAHSVATVSSLPTISVNGTLVGILPALGFYSNLSSILSILDPGQKLLVTAQLSASSTAISLQMAWYEL